MARDEDDALRWEGDDDLTLAPGWKAVGRPGTAAPDSSAPDSSAPGSAGTGGSSGEVVPHDTTGEGRADDAPVGDAPAASAARRQAGSVELVVLGVLGGVYLLYAAGWLATAVRTDAPGGGLLSDVMYLLGLWLAVLAPGLWFGVVFALVPKPALRLAWLAVGAVLLVPLPFVLGVAA